MWIVVIVILNVVVWHFLLQVYFSRTFYGTQEIVKASIQYTKIELFYIQLGEHRFIHTRCYKNYCIPLVMCCVLINSERCLWQKTWLFINFFSSSVVLSVLALLSIEISRHVRDRLIVGFLTVLVNTCPSKMSWKCLTNVCSRKINDTWLFGKQTPGMSTAVIVVTSLCTTMNGNWQKKNNN